MLTKKAKYGLKAMLHLAQLETSRSIFVAELAEQNGIPKKFLDTILGELRNAGMLQSKKGRNGGYTLALRPEDIMVGAIVRTLDGPLAPIACASVSNYTVCADCQTVETCEVRMVMIDVRQAIASVLDQTSLAEIRDKGADPMSNFVYQI